MTLNKNAFYRQEFFLNFLFVLFAGTTLFTRLQVFFSCNLNIIDTDQAFMWAGARDYSNGLFHEPRYYGQDYNTFMEGLFAVPLLWLRVPVYIAVPLATHFISLFPFLFTASYLFFKQKKVQALLVLSVILCLPVEYDLINSLPRGFVTGVFFTSFFIVNILNPADRRFIVINTLLAVTGYFVNPSSMLVSAPFLLYLFLHHYRSRWYYVITLACLAMALPLHLLFNRFYLIHPDYVKNDIHYRLSTDFLWINLSHLDERFAHVSFFVANNSLLLILTLLVLAFFLYLRNKKAFFCFLVFVVVLFFSFCLGKTLEGTTWVYMSYSRVYLGIPMFICLFLSVFSIKIKNMLLPVLMIPLLFATYKLASMNKTLSVYYERKEDWVGVRLIPLKGAMEVIDFYKKVCDQNKAPFLLVSHEFWLNTFLAYGGPAIYKDYPATQETWYEKRYWVREGNKNKVIEKLILISADYNLDKRIPGTGQFNIQRLDDYGLMLITNNQLPTGDLIDHVNTFEHRE